MRVKAYWRINRTRCVFK